MKLQVVCEAGISSVDTKMSLIDSQSQNGVFRCIGWTDEPLTAKVQWVEDRPARTLETSTGGSEGTSTRHNTSPPITVQGKSLLTVTVVRSISVDTDLITAVSPQSTLINICMQETRRLA